MRTRIKPKEVVTFLKFVRSTLGASTRVGVCCCPDEERCTNQVISMIAERLGYVMHKDDALELLRLRPSRMSGSARAFVYSKTEDVIAIIAEGREDRRILNRRKD